ncbi:MAG: CHASE domain-containing protein, partial [Candidatus Binatia bacterium]
MPWLNLVAIVAGGLSVMLGLVVLAGWYTHTAVLLQVLPASVPMVYNTAFGFFLCGVGMLSLVCNWPRLATAFGAVVATVGLLTLIEYMFGVDLGIDQLLMEHYITVETSHPGRMAPSTALAFFLSGSVLLVASRPTWPRQLSLISGILGSVIVALGIVAFFDYLSGVEPAYGWGRLTRMAVHTAAGFMVFGAGIFAFAWRKGTAAEAGILQWFPIPVGIGVATAAVVLWQALLVQEHAQIARTIEREADGLVTEIQRLIEPRILALVRMAKRWENRGKPPRQEWESDAGLYVTHYSDLQAVGWVDPSFHVRWIVPLERNEPVLDVALTFKERRRKALVAGRDRHEVTVTRAIDLVQGDKGFLVYVPIFQGDDFNGFILGVFRFQELLAAAFNKGVALGYSIAVFDGEEE